MSKIELPHRYIALGLLLALPLFAGGCGLFGEEDSEDDSPKQAVPPSKKGSHGVAKGSVAQKKEALKARRDRTKRGTDRASRDVKTPSARRPGAGKARAGAVRPGLGKLAGAKGPTIDGLAARLGDRGISKRTTPAADDSAVLNIKGVLGRSDIKGATGFTGALQNAPLKGIEDRTSYAAVRLKHARGDEYGASLQVWRMASTAAQTRKFNEFARQYPDASRNKSIGSSAFTSEFGGVRYLVWTDRALKTIMALSCDDTICTDKAKAKALAERVNTKVGPIIRKRNAP